MNRQEYGSDVTREQYESIRLLLENARKRTRPRKVDLYDVFCAILYVLKCGCPWRLLPHDFPMWGRVYKYFQVWSEKPSEEKPSLLEQALKKSGVRIANQGRAKGKSEFLHN